MLKLIVCSCFAITEIRCPEPKLAEHAILSVTNNDRMYGRTLIRTADSAVSVATYKIGALVKYRCERGYKIVGDPLSTCEEETGLWSGDIPECVCECFKLLLYFSSNKSSIKKNNRW